MSMDTHPGWTIYEIPTPASDVHTAMYKQVRLSGLFNNPEAFGSTYERESSFSDSTWNSRINTKGRHTLVAVPGDRDTGSAIGTISILGPEMLAGVPQDPEYPRHIADEEKMGRMGVYMVVGMWVQPEYRGKGVGRMLVDRALEAVKLAQPNDGQHVEGSVNADKRVVLLLVHDNQHAAIHLYEKAGFVGHGGVDHGGIQSTWMATTVS